jgi:hypothetical protein
MSQVGVIFTNSGPGGFVQTLTGNSGGPVGPTAGNINVVGAGNITVAGNPGTSTETITLVGTTNHALQIGNAAGSLTSLAVATNGQLPIGSTGADPVIATLTAGPGITITNGAGSITIASSGTTRLTYTAVSTTPYVVLITDEFLGVDSTAAPITIELPNAPATGTVWIIKDVSGTSGTNNITVTTVGGVVLVDAAATFVMNTAYESINVLFNGTKYLVY